MDEAMLLNTPIHELSNYFAQKYRTSVPVLLKDQVTIEQHAAQIDLRNDPTRMDRARAHPQWVAGTRVEVTLPFEGDAACFHMQPTTFTFHPPQGEVAGNCVIFTIEGVVLSADLIRTRIQNMIAEIAKNLRYLQTDANRFNGNLYSYANLLIERQRKKALSDPDAPAAGFRLRAREGELPSAPAAERRQLTPPTPPIIIPQPKAEPELAMKDYDDILQAIVQTAQTLRLSPSALAVMDDTTLRSHFLIPLNARFESRNNQETFTFAADADLSIRIEDKAIFVAAAHFWTGEARILALLDQLLAADAWREVKAALIVINRGRPFAAMLDSLRAALRGHAGFKRELPQLSDTTYLYAFGGSAGSTRDMLLTVLAFDVP